MSAAEEYSDSGRSEASSDIDDTETLSRLGAESDERWRASEPPAENWDDAEGADENGHWEYDIIGEEVDYFGKILYEVRWGKWKRPDGTNTTWNERSEDINTKTWDLFQKRKRQILAAEDLEIVTLTTADIHNTKTYLRSQGYEEKLKDCDQKKVNRVYEMSRLMAKHQGHNSPIGMDSTSSGSPSSSIRSRTSQRTSVRLQTGSSFSTPSSFPTPSSSSIKRVRSVSKTPSIASTASERKFNPSHSAFERPTSISKSSAQKAAYTQHDPPSKVLLSAKAKGKQRAIDSESVEISPVESIPIISPPRKRQRIIRSESPDELSLTPKTLNSPTQPATSSSRRSEWSNDVVAPSRAKLQQRWTQIARKAGAAPINFVNEVDDEDVPPLVPSFKYLESEYKFASDVKRPPGPDEGFLTTCDCHSCVNADLCGCQGASELEDKDGSRIFAYTETGLFAFNVTKGIEVIECNKMCKCTLQTCHNRVSQKPREIPIEIFKTEKRGWGARSSKAIKRGKILGLYTGLVIRRETYLSLPEDQSGYCFDLDGDEPTDTTSEPELVHQKYSVDSMCQGNWTRFINHSCTPNLQIYLAVHDIPPVTGMPFIVFVANQNIPAFTEFTLDYDPNLGEEIAIRKSKWKKKGRPPPPTPPAGSKPCLCESPGCRGFMA